MSHRLSSKCFRYGDNCIIIAWPIYHTVCQLKDGMDTPLYIPKNHITSEPQTNDIEKIRSNVDDEWSVPAKDEPAIVVQLIEAQDEPIPVGGLVLNTNVEKFNVFYKQAISDQEEFKPITFKDTLQEAQVLLQ